MGFMKAILAYITSRATRAGPPGIKIRSIGAADISWPFSADGPKPKVLQPYCNQVRMGWYAAGNPLDVIVCLRLIYAIFPDTIERGRI
jgi:hypothetical protein